MSAAAPARRAARGPQIVNADPPARLGPAAVYLGVSPKTLRRYIAQGKIAAIRIGEQTLAVRQSELERFLSRAA